MVKLAPIVLFVYNRPFHLRKTIDSLSKNILATESELFVYSDGAKNKQDIELVNEVRGYIRTIKGFKNISIIERLNNYGLSGSVINGVSEIIEKYGKIIVLEDDLVTSPYFLKYMNNALNYYACNEQVISIHGYLYPVKGNTPETFFLRGAECWGWATWDRGWKLFEESGVRLLQDIKKHRLRRKLTLNYSYPYYKMLKDQISGKNDSWAIRWYASAYINNKLTMYPGKSLVENIGSDNSGTNMTVATNKLEVDLAQREIHVENVSVEENKKMLRKFEWYYRRLMLDLLVKKILSTIKIFFNELI